MAFKWTTDDGGGLMMLTLTHAYLLHLRLFMSKQATTTTTSLICRTIQVHTVLQKLFIYVLRVRAKT